MLTEQSVGFNFDEDNFASESVHPVSFPEEQTRDDVRLAA